MRAAFLALSFLHNSLEDGLKRQLSRLEQEFLTVEVATPRQKLQIQRYLTDTVFCMSFTSRIVEFLKCYTVNRQTIKLCVTNFSATWQGLFGREYSGRVFRVAIPHPALQEAQGQNFQDQERDGGPFQRQTAPWASARTLLSAEVHHSHRAHWNPNTLQLDGKD